MGRILYSHVSSLSLVSGKTDSVTVERDNRIISSKQNVVVRTSIIMIYIWYVKKLIH